MKKLILLLGLVSASFYAVAMDVQLAQPFTAEALFEAIQKFDEGLALDIIGSGSVNLNARNAKGDTPLHRAVWQGQHMSMVIERLLSEGAEPAPRNKDGQTPWDKAISYHQMHDDITGKPRMVEDKRPNTDAVRAQGGAAFVTFKRPMNEDERVERSYFLKWLRLRLKKPKAAVLRDERNVIYRNPVNACTMIQLIASEAETE